MRFQKGNTLWLGREMESTAKATVSPIIRDLEWAAGFLEGEGSFGRSVSAFQKDRYPLNRLLALFGGVVESSKRDTGFTWRIHGSRGRGVMMTLFSLLSPRRKMQIRRCL